MRRALWEHVRVVGMLYFSQGHWRLLWGYKAGTWGALELAGLAVANATSRIVLLFATYFI